MNNGRTLHVYDTNLKMYVHVPHTLIPIGDSTKVERDKSRKEGEVPISENVHIPDGDDGFKGKKL